MPIAIDTTRTVEYVLAREREVGDGHEVAPRPDATVFTLRPLTARQYARIMQVHASGGTGAAALESVRHGLAGVRNFADGKGAAVPFETRAGALGQEVTDAFLDRLSMSWLIELSNAINDLNRIGEDEAKN